jgi:hypothetical protein
MRIFFRRLGPSQVEHGLRRIRKSVDSRLTMICVREKSNAEVWELCIALSPVAPRATNGGVIELSRAPNLRAASQEQEPT